MTSTSATPWKTSHFPWDGKAGRHGARTAGQPSARSPRSPGTRRGSHRAARACAWPHKVRLKQSLLLVFSFPPDWLSGAKAREPPDKHKRGCVWGHPATVSHLRDKREKRVARSW